MATPKITRLTPEQERDLPHWRDRWLQHGLSTEPADRPRAEAAFRLMYREIGEQEPFVLWLDSPASAVLAAAVFKAAKPIDIQKLWGQLGDQLRNFAGWGSWEWWIPVYVYPRDVLGLVYPEKESRRLNAWVDLMQSAGWWMPFRGMVIACERPTAIHRDERGRLHCEDGPALVFRDGYGVWSWHGVRVPQDVIEKPETLTAPQVLKEPNTEVRRVMVERYGRERLMHDGGGEVVHTDDWGKLWRLPLQGDEPLVLVEVLNSTPEPDGTFKPYLLRVPPTVRTAKEGVFWTHDLPIDATPVAMT